MTRFKHNVFSICHWSGASFAKVWLLNICTIVHRRLLFDHRALLFRNRVIIESLCHISTFSRYLSDGNHMNKNLSDLVTDFIYYI